MYNIVISFVRILSGEREPRSDLDRNGLLPTDSSTAIFFLGSESLSIHYTEMVQSINNEYIQ